MTVGELPDRVLVCGVGVAGTSLLAVLSALGVNATGYDEKTHTEPPDVAAFDLVVTSPGWRPDHPLLLQAAAVGIPVWGDAELAWRLNPPQTRWLVVTGTNGKTTATEMLDAMLRESGARSAAAGNIGTPLVDAVTATPPYDLLAAELSSFQLHWSSSIHAAAAALLNVAEDHLDWHGSFEAYAGAKARVWSHQDAADVAIANSDDPVASRLVRGAGGRQVGFTLGVPADGQLGVVDGFLVDHAFGADRLVAVAELQVVGPHNVANALAACGLALAAGADGAAVGRALRAFTTGAHRNQVVAEIDGVRYVNDSKATNPHAAAASLRAYERVVWVAGGLNKGLAFDDLVHDVRDNLVATVLIGTCADEIAAALARHAPHVPVHRASDLHTAVETARALARPGDVVLLAPAAASQDMFRNYAERGDTFAAAARALEER